MRVVAYIYDSASTGEHVPTVLEYLRSRERSAEHIDIAARADRRDGLRDAMLTLRESLRIGENPEAIYDADGELDFSPGVLITEEETGRRAVHVGEEALDVLRDDRSAE